MLPPTRVTQTEALPTGILIIISNECRYVAVGGGDDDDYDYDNDDRDSSL